ncbi:MAG: hypothetical protein HS116_18215 [Planctomycetes bacterium]|nr:hypothetical protein [Planctomycetota bacterium]
MSKPKLRLEWIESGSLDENPLNWRRHSPEQLQSIRDLLSDPDVGWAGACLYNERTKRLIDGHARKSVSDPKQLVPVLVGEWSEEAEKKILATLDPVGAMAQGDAEAYATLVEMVQAESLWVRDLIHNTQAALLATEDGADETEPQASAVLPQMECQPFEHYDYLMLLFRNEQDFQQACERLGIQRVQVTYPGGKQKIGLGRCLDGMKALKTLTAGGAQ